MSYYRLYHIGHDGHFACVDEIVCDSDREALAKAAEIPTTRQIEVWQQERFVARVSAEKVQSSNR